MKKLIIFDEEEWNALLECLNDTTHYVFAEENGYEKWIKLKSIIEGRG